MVLLACTSDLFLMKRDDTLNGYGSAIRWGIFEKALEFQNPAHRKRLDEAWLKSVHISSYDTVYLKEDPNSKVVEQTVNIHYYLERDGIDKSITDRQVWRFDDDKNKWMLETDLPAFR